MNGRELTEWLDEQIAECESVADGMTTGAPCHQLMIGGLPNNYIVGEYTAPSERSSPTVTIK